ncbi:MAG: hypothetical protein WCK32_10070 [Chlorobiaceae bacterium]
MLSMILIAAAKNLTGFLFAMLLPINSLIQLPPMQGLLIWLLLDSISLSSVMLNIMMLQSA